MARNVSGIDEFMEGCDYEILDKVPADYYCPICFKLLCNATQMKCGHVLCQQCLNQHANVLRERNEDCFCPVDRIKVNMQSVTQVLFIDRLILSIQVKCQRNCQWTGDLGNLKEHREKCPSKRCPNEGCNLFLLKSKMKNHKKICNYNQAICPFAVHGCNVELRNFEMENHFEQCSKDHLAFLEKAFNELQIKYTDKVTQLKESESQLKKCKKDKFSNVKSLKLRVAESIVSHLKQECAEKTKVINESQIHIKMLEDHHKELHIHIKMLEDHHKELHMALAYRDFIDEEREEVRKLNNSRSNLRFELENKIDGLSYQINELEIKYQREKRENKEKMIELMNIKEENDRLRTEKQRDLFLLLFLFMFLFLSMFLIN